MIIGIPREIKDDEYRVALLPVGVEQLKARGHQVLVEQNAGGASGFTDEQYKSAGAVLTASAQEVYEQAEMIVKVKEPLQQEWRLLRRGQILFAFLHFAASEELTRAAVRSECVAIAYETIETEEGVLPLLTPMSEVAGRMAVQQAAKYLEREHGGRGILLGGVPGVEPATVVILGAGVAGSNAARMAAGLGARVCLLDINLDRLRYLSEVMPPNVVTLMSNPENIRAVIREGDVLISAVLVHGGKAPTLVTREMLASMKQGAVIVDVAVDQGGSVETSRPTRHEDPIYTVDGIVHYCVSNMPGAVPATSTTALTNATLPYVSAIADHGYEKALMVNREIRRGANIVLGVITYKNVADAFGMPSMPVDTVLAGKAVRA